MDSARSWVVAASCAWIMLFNFVIIRSAAVFYIVILQSFHATREEASWPITISTALFNIAGCSLAFVILCYTVINAHFDRYKAVASGIGNAGITVGGLIFPPLAQFIFDEYGTRSGLLLCGAIMLNGVVGAFFLRALTKDQQERPRGLKRTVSDDKTLDAPDSDSSVDPNGSSPGWKSLRNSIKRLSSKFPERQNSILSVRTKSDEMFLQLRHSSVPVDLGNSVSVLQAPPSTPKSNKYVVGRDRRKERTASGQVEVIELRSPRKDANYPPPVVLISHRDVRKTTSGCGICSLLSFMAFPKFYLLGLSLALIYLNMTTYVTVIIDLAMDRNIAKWNAIYLVGFYTSADLLARLVSGIITDKQIVTRSTMMAANYMFWGVSLCLVPLCHSYHIQVLLAITSGWSNGAVFVLASVVCMDVAGADKFSMCYGMACFVAGLPLLARPAIVGYYRDGLGDYQGLFVVQGLLTASVAFLWLGVSLQEKCKHKARVAIPVAETCEHLSTERL
ncbi:unnamed protein product [Ixodes persulcatus]